MLSCTSIQELSLWLLGLRLSIGISYNVFHTYTKRIQYCII